jgi:hypothetical protein
LLNNTFIVKLKAIIFYKYFPLKFPIKRGSDATNRHN